MIIQLILFYNKSKLGLVSYQIDVRCKCYIFFSFANLNGIKLRLSDYKV